MPIVELTEVNVLAELAPVSEGLFGRPALRATMVTMSSSRGKGIL
jgi:hypothetical protein